LRIASFNINDVNKRLSNLLAPCGPRGTGRGQRQRSCAELDRVGVV